MDHCNTRQALVERGLERVAEALGDMTAPLMARYYAAFPDAKAVFEYQGVGRRDLLEAEMVGNVVYFLMTWFERPDEIRNILYTSIPHHQDTLKVGPGWYLGMLEVAIELIEASLPDDAAEERAMWHDMRNGFSEAIAKAQGLSG